MLITNGEYEGSIGLEEFVDKFYSKIIENVLNVVATQWNQNKKGEKIEWEN